MPENFAKPWQRILADIAAELLGDASDNSSDEETILE